MLHRATDTKSRLGALLLVLLLALAASTAALAAPVDVNSADAATLAAGMKGVGLAKAEAIVAYRDSNGPFKTLDELTQVKGIGAKTVERNRANLVVGSP